MMWPTSRVAMTSAAAAATGGVLFVLFLAFSPAAGTLTQAGLQFDRDLFTLLNRFARRSSSFDAFVWQMSHSVLLQGAMMALFWGAWFARLDPTPGRRRRETMLTSLVGLYATVALAIALRAVLPYRARPALDPALAFQVPYAPLEGALHSQSTSLPAGHAAVFFAIAVGLWSISVRLGIVASLYALFIVCLPRVYLGFHYPTDILAGAILAIISVVLANETLKGRSLMAHVLAWSEKRPAVFYAVLFLCSLDIAMEFASVRPLLRLLGSAYFRKLVMLVTGVATA